MASEGRVADGDVEGAGRQLRVPVEQTVTRMDRHPVGHGGARSVVDLEAEREVRPCLSHATGGFEEHAIAGGEVDDPSGFRRWSKALDDLPQEVSNHGQREEPAPRRGVTAAACPLGGQDVAAVNDGAHARYLTPPSVG
jgi:hypothetical protein